MLEQQIEYEFDQEPVAYRFLNTVKNWQQRNLRAVYGSDACAVKITYQPNSGAFDDTLARLDNLAEQMGGRAL
jgi:hypothetical protein